MLLKKQFGEEFIKSAVPETTRIVLKTCAVNIGVKRKLLRI